MGCDFFPKLVKLYVIYCLNNRGDMMEEIRREVVNTMAVISPVIFAKRSAEGPKKQQRTCDHAWTHRDSLKKEVL